MHNNMRTTASDYSYVHARRLDDWMTGLWMIGEHVEAGEYGINGYDDCEVKQMHRRIRLRIWIRTRMLDTQCVENI